MRELGYRIDSRKVGELTFVHIAWNSRLVKKEKVARIQRGPGLHRFERSKWQHNPTCLTLLASLLWVFLYFCFFALLSKIKVASLTNLPDLACCVFLESRFFIFLFLYILISLFHYFLISLFPYCPQSFSGGGLYSK